ncbi:MAG: hydrogenase maturation nickel metallochaperone HypA [Nitrospirota bacterium]
MHEFALARQLVRVVQRRLPPGGPRRVTAITLRLGELTGVTPDSLRLGFEQASAGTPAEGARLDVETVDGNELWVVRLEWSEADGRGP